CEREWHVRHLARVLNDGLRRYYRARTREERESVEWRVNVHVLAALIKLPRPPVNPVVALREIDLALRRSLCDDRRDEQVASDEVLVFNQVSSVVVRVLDPERAHHGCAREPVLVEERVEVWEQTVAQLD